MAFTFPPPPPPPPTATIASPSGTANASRSTFSRGGRREKPSTSHHHGGSRGGHHRPARIVDPRPLDRHDSRPTCSVNDAFSTAGVNAQRTRAWQPPDGRSNSERGARTGPHERHGPKKRVFADAFSPSVVESQVAPAVPHFGFPIMSSSTSKKHDEKQNALGLTPAGNMYPSSDEGNDYDEEAQLKAAVCSVANNPVQRHIVTHNDRTYYLRTADEVASWIRQRRSNFPTAARRTERQRQLDLAAAKAKLQLARSQAVARPSLDRQNKNVKDPPESTKTELDGAQKGFSSSVWNTGMNDQLLRQHSKEGEPNAAEIGPKAEGNGKSTAPESSLVSLSESSSSESSSDAEDLTSSSGSSDTSDAETEAPPKEQPSKEDHRSPVFENRRPQHQCYQYRKFGRCKRGPACHYSHTGASRQRKTVRQHGCRQPGRISLFQRFWKQERDAEMRTGVTHATEDPCEDDVNQG